MAENSRKKVESAGTLKIAIVLYDRAAVNFMISQL